MLKAYQTDAGNSHAQVIGIAVDRTDAVRQFAADNPFNYPVLLGQSDAMDAAGLFGDFVGLPFTVFVESTGAILTVLTGEVTQGDLDNFDTVLRDLDNHSIGMQEARSRMNGAL